MRSLARLLLTLAILVFAGCAASHPVYDYEGEPTPASPSPVASPIAVLLPPFPLILVPTDGMRIYGVIWDLVTIGCVRWNAALGEVIFKQTGTGRAITTDIMNSYLSGTGTAIGEVDNLTNPHRMALWVGILPPTDKAVVLHELGHLLGLKHSELSDDVMYFRNGFATDLSQNDIQRGKLAVAARRQQVLTTP